MDNPTDGSDRREFGSKYRRRQRKTKLILFLVSLACSTVALITFDYSYSAAIRRNAQSSVKPSPCRVFDPVLQHALKPNCVSVEDWGRDRYEVVTNSFGFRDEKVREVPLADHRPRILMLGNSFTEGALAWRDSYVGRVAAHFQQYHFLNGGAGTYSPSNFLNVARMVLNEGAEIDEVIVFLDSSAVQDEAAFYRDVDASGAVTGPERMGWKISRYAKLRFFIARNLLLTNDIVQPFERFLVLHGYYRLPSDQFGDNFDMGRAAWTYRKVDETGPFPAGYAPLGVEGGIAKEKAKMTLLWRELKKWNIPISVVVYPYPAQVAHDTADSRQVRIWREWCEGKCKRFISLFPAFLAVKEQCPPSQPGCWYLKLFIFGDPHYNAAGNALVADEVIKSLEEDPVEDLPSNLQQQNPSPAR